VGRLGGPTRTLQEAHAHPPKRPTRTLPRDPRAPSQEAHVHPLERVPRGCTRATRIRERAKVFFGSAASAGWLVGCALCTRLTRAGLLRSFRRSRRPKHRLLHFFWRWGNRKIANRATPQMPDLATWAIRSGVRILRKRSSKSANRQAKQPRIPLFAKFGTGESPPPNRISRQV
jgi:hypothetical protein